MRKAAWMLPAWLVLTLPPSVCSLEAQKMEGIGDSARLERESSAQILKISRVYVDRFGGGENAAHVRDMIISSLNSAKLFVITENEERADAFLRGSAEDLIFTDTFSSNENLSARTSLGIGRDPNSSSSDRRSRSGTASVGESESIRTAERKHEATASVRLVNKDGDVLWSTTQESLGGKFRGASADVADKITKRLIQDYQRAKKQRNLQQK